VVVEGLAAAFVGGKIPELPPALGAALNDYLAKQLDTDLALAVKTGNADAVKKALAVIKDDKAPTLKRASLVQAFAEAGDRSVVPAILQIFNRAGSAAGTLRQAVLPYAARFDDPALAQAVVKGYEARFSQTVALRSATHRFLVSRPAWAKLFLQQVERADIKPREVAPDIVRQLELYHDPEIDALVRKHWSAASAKLSSQEKLAEMLRLKRVLATPGDAAHGKELFTQRCAACHTLFGEGGKIGPELTGYERSNPDFWLLAILDPSAEIREGYGAYNVKMKDGQSLMGMLVQQDASNVVLKDMAGQTQTLRAAQVEKLEAFPQSLMPEGLLTGADDATVRDLFAYLMRP
jgi:putative heme-binding domain-containing protein